MAAACSSRSMSDLRPHKTNPNSEQALKCPRCDSTNTKFCYYNNYSLTQPRHFCKNCRRYWTKGGALRNVPVGGGCRKNKRVKQRSVDPSSLVSMDESASSMLASIHNGNCGGLLPNFGGGSTCNYGDLSSDSHMLSVAFSRFQESLRLGEQSESNSGLFGGMGHASNSQSATRLLMNTACQPSLMSSMRNYENELVSIGYATPTVIKSEHGHGTPAVMYTNGSSNMFLETPSRMTGSATATLASLENQLSSFGLPVESFENCNNLETQIKLQQQKLALQLHNGVDREHVLPAFEDETHDNNNNNNIRRLHSKGKSLCLDGRSLSGDWPQHQATNDNIFDLSQGDHHNFWNHSGWPAAHDMHTITGSTAGAAML